MPGTRFVFTYTSSYAHRWLELQGLHEESSHAYLSRTTLQDLTTTLANISSQDRALIILEKDRRRSVLRLHKDSRFILNIEAKPPQSLQSAVYERFLSRSIKTVSIFAVENELYARDIRRYGNHPPVHVTGTLKAPRGPGFVRSLSGACRVSFVSAHGQEINVVKQAVKSLSSQTGKTQIVIVPRYVGRGFFSKNGRRFLRNARAHFPGIEIVGSIAELQKSLSNREHQSVLYNAIGDVPRLLDLTDVAVVCGSLKKGFLSNAKGHNFMEPLALGIPSFVGPFVRNWAYSVAEFQKEGILFQSRAEDLGHEIADVLEDNLRYESLSRKILHSEVLRFHQQSDTRVATLVCSLFENRARRRMGLLHQTIQSHPSQ